MRLIIILSLFLAMCGHPANVNSDSEIADTTAYDIRTIFGTETLTEITPNMTADNTGIATLQLSFEIAINYEKLQAFIYDKSRWKLGFRKNDSSTDTINWDGVVTSTGASAIEKDKPLAVVLSITFPNSTIPKIYSDLIVADAQGRRGVKLVATYVNSDTVNDDKSYAFVWQNDIGVIKEAPTMLAPQLADGMLIARWTPPKTVTSVVLQNSQLVDSGTSSISSYLLVYWDPSTCTATGQWNFLSNPDIAKGEATACTFAGSDAQGVGSSDIGAGTCSLGCSSGTLDAFGGKSLEDIAVPGALPSSVDVTKLGCMYVKKVPARASATVMTNTIDDLKNATRYGMMVYAVDSSGHIGMGRSACAFASPVLVPLASDQKAGGKSKTKSDCFVATAASSDSESRSVVYWRIIRDTYLKNSSFVAWYYKNGPQLAHWLDNNPSLKPAINFMLETSGSFLVKARKYFKVFTAGLSRGFSSEAFAQALPLNTTGSIFSVYGGQGAMTTDKAIWDKYYIVSKKPHRPIFLGASQTYVIWGINWFDISMGPTLGYLTNWGSSALAPRGTSTTMYAFTGQAILEARVQLWAFGLRVGAGGGGAFMREEASQATVPEGGNSPIGYSFLKPITGARVALDFYFGDFFPEDKYSLKWGMGINNLALTGSAEYLHDLSKTLSLSSLLLSGGITFLFE